MNDEPSTNNSQPNFVKKQVEAPILDQSVRSQISGGAEVQQSFYAANKLYFWAIGLGVFIIALLAFFAFRDQGAPTPKEANVIVEIDAPSTAASGGEIIYKVKVENKDSEKLVGLELELAYPEGVSYISSSPKAENLSGTQFKVPDLISGQNAVVIVKVKATGNINDEKKLVGKLRYQLSNFSSYFTKEQSHTARLVSSDFVLELTGPGNANNAQLVIYELKYKNNSKEEIKNGRIQLTYAQGFSYASASPPPDLGDNIWNIPSLASGGEGVIQIQGSYRSSGAGESKTVIADFQILGQDGQFFTQSQTSAITAIANLPLIVTQDLEVHGQNNVVDPGDDLTFRINYQNNASTVATGVNILVTLNSKVLDLSTLQAEGGLVNNNTILWNASQIAQLENLSPSESGQLTFRVRVNNPATKDSSKNLNIVSQIKIKANEYETYLPGNELTLKVSSPANIGKSLSYVNGSLPPKVGTQTTYRVVLTLTNSSNDFSDTILFAYIPLGAGGFVEGSVNSGENTKVEYDSSTGKLTWKAGALPAYTGRFSQARRLEFNVRLNPSASQTNLSPVLVKDISVTAKDNYTENTVELFAEDISTRDLSGEDGFNKGTVVP